MVALVPLIGAKNPIYGVLAHGLLEVHQHGGPIPGSVREGVSHTLRSFSNKVKEGKT